MIRRPPRSTRTDTLFPYTTLFRSAARRESARTDADRYALARSLPIQTPPCLLEWRAQGACDGIRNRGLAPAPGRQDRLRHFVADRCTDPAAGSDLPATRLSLNIQPAATDRRRPRPIIGG